MEGDWKALYCLILIDILNDVFNHFRQKEEKEYRLSLLFDRLNEVLI